jgi:DNA polymerase III epsilon subunit-like protein/methylphosphotriester-DNA--protein-cysteine methyltransferase/energy-coupling factor transporter ATP-binding protein EcfA2
VLNGKRAKYRTKVLETKEELEDFEEVSSNVIDVISENVANRLIAKAVKDFNAGAKDEKSKKEILENLLESLKKLRGESLSAVFPTIQYTNGSSKNLGEDWAEVVKKLNQSISDMVNFAFADAKELMEVSQGDSTEPAVEEGRRLNDPAVPSNLGTKTGTNVLPQTGDNYNPDGTPAYAPSTGPIRGSKFRAMVSEAYRRGGWKGVKDLIKRSNVVSFDTETTGIEDYDGQLKPGNRLVQLGASRVNKDGKTETFNIYINPETGVIMSDWSKDNLLRPELDENGKPTGNYIKIEKDWLQQQADEKTALEDFIKFLGDDVVLLGHNLNFDISVLQDALDRHGLSINAIGSIDTMDFAGYSLPTYNPTGKTRSGKDSKDGIVLDGPRRPSPEVKPEDLDPNNPLHFQASKKLGDVLQYFGLEPTGWHRADADAQDAYRILENIVDWLINNPGKESSNPLGIKALEFEKINSVADREIGNYLRAIGSGQPATSRQTNLNTVDKNGKSSPGFATDLRKLDVSEEEIRNILSSMSGMTRGQAGDYIASILSDIRSGKPADIKKALQEAKYTKKSTSPGNAVPNATSQEQGFVEHEIQKRASDLNVGDKVRREDSDVYGIIKSIDKSIAGIVNLTIAYEDGETVEMSIRPSKKVAVYEQDNPKDSNTPEPANESDAPTPSESPDQNPTEAAPPAAVEEDAESAEPNILDEYTKIVELVEYGLKNIPSSIEKFSSEEIDKIVESLFQKLIDSGLFNVEVFNKIYGLMAKKMNSNASYGGGDWLPFIRKSELESIFNEITKDSTQGQEQEQEQEQGVTVDVSSYPVQQREGIREFTEILDRLNSLEGKTPKIRVVESGSQPKLVERTPKFIEAFASKEDIEKALTDLGISKFKARRIAKKLERLDGTKEYFTELRKINEDLAKEERNKKSFKNIEKVIDFGEFLRQRGTPEGYDLYLSEDPRDIAKLARERALYKAWEKSLKNRKPIKTITDGNISVTFSSDEAEHAERILDSAKKIQEQFPLDGRKLKVSFYSPEQLAILDIGEIVGASIVTDKLAHIAITSSIAGREEMDPRRNGSGKKDFSDLFVLIHEYGHVYDEIALNGKTREKFAEQFKDSDITTYAGEDLSENFAEHFMDLAYSGLKGKKPVSAEFKKFMKDGKASGDIDPTVLKKSGPFFGDAIVSPRRVSASVQGVTLRGVGEKVDSELQNFENATSTGNGTSGEWLKGTDDEAGYIPDLSKDDIAKEYIDQIPELGVSLEEFNSSNDEDKASILNKVREILQPLVDAQRQDSRKYRVLTVDGTNTHIRFKEGSVDAETLSDLIYEVKSLNNFSDMGGMPVIITLAENNTFTVKGELFNGDDAGINLMNSSGTQMHIVLNTKFAKEKPESDPNNKYISSSKTTMLETLVHEYLGHGLAKIFFGQKYLNRQEDNERFIEFKSKFPLPEDERDHPVSAYGGTSHEESFAEYVRAAYDIVTFGKSPTDYPEIREFLNFIDSRMETYGPVIKTDKAGSDLALVDRRVVSNTPSFPQPTKYAGELAAVDTFNSRETHYSNNLDPYGRPVGADFTETLETAYGLVSKARKEYYRNPSDDNFIAFASLASVLNEIYNSRYFNYPKNTPRYTDESVLNSIKTSENASSIRRWQTSKPFVPLRYPTTSEKFNNEFTVSSYTDVNGDVYQVVFVSSKPAIDEDGVSESAHVFASKPNQPLSYFVDSGTSFNDLVKKSAGQMKITNFEQGSLLAATDLEIQSTYVQGKNRRKGLATAMLAVAKQNSRKNLRFSKQQTIQEDSWARSVDQNSENHLGMPAFTDPDGGLRPADRSPLTSPAVGYRKTDWADDEAPRINYNSDARDEAEEEAFDAFSSRYLSSSVFSGSRDYYSSNGGGMGLDQSVVGAVKVSTLKSMAGNAVDEVRVLELMEKIKSGEGFKDPVIVYYDPETKDTIVADGNHHVEASSRLGLDFVPTRVIVGKFDSSDFVSPKKATRDWKNNPFKSKDWPRHVNPYFVFGAEDLISYADNDVVIDRRRIISSVGKVEPNEISKLIGRYVLDNVTGQIYMVYDEHYDSENKPTGKIVVERFVGTFDKLGSVIETRVDGKLTFNKNGKLLLKKGQANFTNEYNDIRQYELEIRDLKDFQDVTESFVKSGGKPLVVTESMFFIWSGRDIKGKINKFLSPGKVQLAELIGIDDDGEREYRLHEVPVTELGLIQGQRESLGEEVVDHSQDMLAGKVLYALVIENAKTLLADGFIDRSFFEAILETVKGKFQTKSGVEDMLKSLDRLNRRRVRQKRAEVLEKKLATATTRKAVAVKSKVEETPKDSEKPVVIGRMTFLQLYKQTLEDKKNGVTRDPFADTKSPATEEGTNPLSQPNIDAVSEAAIALAELTDINSDFGFTQQEGIAIMLALKTSTNAGAKDIIEQLRARVLAKRMEAGQPIGDLRIPEKIDSDELKKYTPKVNMDGTPYTGPKGTIFDETTIYGEPEQIIDYIKYVLSPGDFLAITGGAGTGKTTLIRQLLEKSKGINVATVTPTGKTAMQIAAASTVHSLFGFSKDTGLSEEFDIEVEDTDENGNPVLIKYDSREQFVAKYAGTKKGKALATLDLLVIDEVSMINANLMDAMDLALRVAKGKLGIPFGGVKVVAFGDDNQLPPVEYWNPDSNRTKKLNDDLKKGKLDKEEYDAKMRVELAKKAKHEYMLLDYDSYRWFDSKVFAQQKPLHKRLTTIYRQKDDVAFAELLGRLANATEISQDDIDLINSRYGGIPKDPNALRIVLTNARADLINKKAIEKLQQSGAPSAEFIGEFNGIRRVFADDDLFAPEKITYFVGEKVVFTVNDGKDLQDQVGYRGDRRWSNGTEGTVVGFDEDTGLPVVEIKVGDEVVKVVVGKANSAATGADTETVFDEISGSPQERFSTKTEADYTQIPMIPAYAITVHKAQGMTIQGEAIVDFLDEDGEIAKPFASGQAYVALSRFTKLENMYLTRKITASDFMSDDNVTRYYKTVEDIEIGESVKNAKKEMKEKEQQEKPAQPVDDDPTVDRRVVKDSGDKILLDTISKADVKSAKKILEHKTKPVSGLPSDWGTTDLADYFFSQFGYGEESSFKQNLNAIMSEKPENLHLEQKLLVSLIAAHGKADIYTHAETGTTIKRHLKGGLFNNKDASDNEVLLATAAHKRILDSGLVIDGGRMDINLRDLSYIGEPASGLYSASKDEINIDTSQVYGWKLQGDRNKMSEGDQFAYVVAHEYAHALDNKLAENGERLSVVLENLIKSGMQNRAKEILRMYALTSPPEYFAESYAGLILQSVLNQLGYSDKTAMDETLIDEVKNRINSRNSQ